MSQIQGRHPPSLWAATAAAPPYCPPLDGPEEADVVIVGGGFTGLSAALHLAERGKRAIVLEAEGPGFGASGRNGGQVNPGMKLNPDELRAHYGGGEAGARTVRLADGACDLVFQLIERHAIECEAIRPGYVQAAPDAAGAAALRRRAESWAAEGVDLDFLEGAAACDLLGTDRYTAATLDPRGGNLNPLAYARGLARAALAAGATIHAESRATTLARAGAGWRVETPGGSVSAAHVLLCTNGYTDALWPDLAQAVVPVASAIAATRPMPPRLAQSVLPGRHAVSDTARSMLYFKRDGADRFVIGARGQVLGPPDAGPAEIAKRGALKLFPQLAELEFEFEWGGYVALTTDWTPRLMRPAPGVLAAIGLNGRGVAMGTALGRDLAGAIEGEPTGIPITEGVRRIPFHRFRKIGVAWHIAKARMLDRMGL